MSVSPETIVWQEAYSICGDDRDFLQEVLTDYVGEAEEAMKALHDAIVAENFAQVYQAAHKMKGNSAYLNCNAMKEICYSIQLASAETTIEKVPKLQHLYGIYCRCVDELKIEIQNHFSS